MFKMINLFSCWLSNMSTLCIVAALLWSSVPVSGSPFSFYPFLSPACLTDLIATAPALVPLAASYAAANPAAVAALHSNSTTHAALTNGTAALADACASLPHGGMLCSSTVAAPGGGGATLLITECLPKTCSSVSDRHTFPDVIDVALSTALNTPLMRQSSSCPTGGLLSWAATVALCTAAVCGTVGFLAVLVCACTRWPQSSRPPAPPPAPKPAKPLWMAWDPRANLASLVTPGPLAPLDGLRSLAVLWVVCFHSLIELNQTSYFSHTWGLVSSGDLGVDVFFALSGFLMAFVLLGRKPGVHQVTGQAWCGFLNGVTGVRPLRFLFRRWVRLTPAYLVAIVANVLATGIPGMSETCKANWWKNLLFVNNEVRPWLTDESCIGQSWSIAIEAQFYVVSPFIVVTMWKWPWATATSIAACSTALRAFMFLYLAGTSENFNHNLAAGFSSVYTQIHTRMMPYVAGMLACVLVKKGEGSQAAPPAKPAALVQPLLEMEAGGEPGEPPPPTASWGCEALAAVALVVWGACSWLGAMGTTVTAMQWGIGYGWPMFAVLVFTRGVFGAAISAMIWLMLRPLAGQRRGYIATGVRWVLSWRLHIPIARLSYSTYLLQFLIMANPWFGPKMQPFKPEGDASAAAFFTTALQLVCVLIQVNFLALLTYLIVEKPLMNLRR